MLILSGNANSEIKRQAFGNSVRACYLSVCERYTKSQKQMFILDLQTLITKLGQMIAAVTVPRQNPLPYSAQNIDFLCNVVVGRPDLKRRFERLRINDMGNRVKHSTRDAEIDMDKCAEVYNDLVGTIAKQYGLPALTECMLIKARRIVEKTYNAPAQSYYDNMYGYQRKSSNVPRIVAATPQPPAKKKSVPNSTMAITDERIKMRVTLKRGDGRYSKGIIKKVGMVNFFVGVSISNPDFLPIVSVVALFQCGSNKVEKKLSKALDSTTEVDLETAKFFGNIKVTVTATYKIGLLKTKQIVSTVSDNF